MKPSDDQGTGLPPLQSPPQNLGEARINQEAIGARLRELFEEVVNEAVPDEFLEILRMADERATGSDASGADEKR